MRVLHRLTSFALTANWFERLAEQLEKLRKNQERRLQRKNAKMGVAGDVFLPGGKKIKNETTVSCILKTCTVRIC